MKWAFFLYYVVEEGGCRDYTSKVLEGRQKRKNFRLYVLISHITYHLKRKPRGSILICDAATNLTLLVSCQDETYIFTTGNQ